MYSLSCRIIVKRLRILLIRNCIYLEREDYLVVMMKENTISKRNSAISLSRVTGMVFIVLCHTIGYYEFVPGNSFLGQFFNCGVYLFLFISGYLYGGKQIDCFHVWYLKRFLTVSLPAIVISFFVIVAWILVGQQISLGTFLAYAIDLEGLLFINWNLFSVFFQEILSLGPLWFTTIIMLCYLLVPLLHRISSKIKQCHFVLFIIIFAFISILVSLLLLYYCSITITYFVLFTIAFFIGKLHLLEKVNYLFFFIYSLLFIISIVGRIALRQIIDGTSIYFTYAMISYFIVGTWFVIFYAFLNNKFSVIITYIADSVIVKKMDKYSYYIYLVHGVFCMSRFNVYDYFSLFVATILFVLLTSISAVLLYYIVYYIRKPLIRKLNMYYNQ